MGIGGKLVGSALGAFAALCGGMAARTAPAQTAAEADAVVLRPIAVVGSADPRGEPASADPVATIDYA